MKHTFAFLLSLAVCLPLSAQSDVGEVAFANSGAPAAQPAFRRGLALLHNFEYPYAAESFREAQKIDAGFAMAYWGEAMTYTHPVWQQQDADAARASLKRLGSTPSERAAKAPTERERAYLQAVEVLYGEGTKHDRDFLFSDAMAAIHARYSDDVDATAFSALALLGTSHHGRDTAIYMRAAALLEEVFPAHKNHPGVLHYMIHCYDDPVHAPLGVRPARLYGAVAPNAGHALHMTSHIFIALGMWDEVIDVNKQAIAVVNVQRAGRGKSPQNCGHYPTWLHYGLLQERRFAEAKAMLDACRADAFDPAFKGGGMMDTPAGRVQEYSRMVAHQVASGGGYDAAAEGAVSAELDTDAGVELAYAAVLAAARQNNAEALERVSARMKAAHQKAADSVASRNKDGDPNYLQRMTIVSQQVQALQMFAAGKRSDAIALLRKTADAESTMPFEFGPPFIEKPSLELLADHLMLMGSNADAATAYRAALARTPGRTLSLEGLMRAQKAQSATDEAAKTATQLQRYVKTKLD